MSNMFNRLNRYQDNLQNFRQNWRQEMRNDWQGYRQNYTQQIGPYARQGRDYFNIARDYIGHNMFSDDYYRLPCVRNRRNPYGHQDFARAQLDLPGVDSGQRHQPGPYHPGPQIPRDPRGPLPYHGPPVMSGALPYHTRRRYR
jgi:hypothetical protein